MVRSRLNYSKLHKDGEHDIFYIVKVKKRKNMNLGNVRSIKDED